MTARSLLQQRSQRTDRLIEQILRTGAEVTGTPVRVLTSYGTGRSSSPTPRATTATALVLYEVLGSWAAANAVLSRPESYAGFRRRVPDLDRYYADAIRLAVMGPTAKRGTPWTTDEEKVLVREWGRGSLARISAAIWLDCGTRRSERACDTRMRKLGLIGGYTGGFTSLSELGRDTGYDRKQIKRAILALGLNVKRSPRKTTKTGGGGIWLLTPTQVSRIMRWFAENTRAEETLDIEICCHCRGRGWTGAPP